MRLILFGPPGSGKGTIGEMLGRERGWARVATGDIIRAEIRAGSDLGRQARALSERGELVPDELVIAMVGRRLQQADVAAGCILDGYPRTLAQARALDAVPAAAELAVFLQVDEATVIDRLVTRLTCKGCGAIYNQRTHPPRQPGVCDGCGGEVGRRSDDNEATVTQRLRVYLEQTAPVVDHYRNRGLLREVDGRGAADAVFQAVRRVVP